MCIEDYIDLYDVDSSINAYYTCLKKDMENGIQRYCKECGSIMKISKKGKAYCSSICWDNNIEIQSYYHKLIEERICEDTVY